VVRYGRIAVLGCVLAMAAAAAPASPGAAKFDATLSARTTGGTAWCCGQVVEFEGSGVVMRMGAVEFTGQWIAGCSFATLPTPCFRRLDLVLRARNGDQLSVRGANEWTQPVDPAPAAMTWASDPANSTGRFADFTASGTYTLVQSADGASVTISLAGLKLHGAA
jgi:hypothetical protein